MPKDSIGSLFLELSAKTDKLESDLKKGLSKIEGQINSSGKRFERSMTSSLKKIGAAIGITFSVKKVKDFFQASIREAASYQKSIISVTKTTDLAGAELFRFEKGIQALERRIPKTAQELIELSAAAGQLGVRGSSNLLKFAETLARLESTTDGLLAGGDAARGIARLLSITGSGAGQVDKFGSAITALGNASKATEAEILAISTRVGQAVAAFDVSTPNVLGLATAMKELGIEAELGGSSINRAFVAISLAVSEGGQKLDAFAKLAGQSSEQFQQLFRSDSLDAFVQVLDGLGRTDAPRVLTELGLAGARNLSVFPLLARHVSDVRRALELSNQAWKDNRALLDESNRSFAGYNAKLQLFQNRLNQAARSIGNTLLPALTSLLDTLSTLFDFAARDPWAPLVTAGLTALATIETGFVNLLGLIGSQALDLASRLEAGFKAAFLAIANFGHAVFVGTFNSIRSGLEALINAIIDGINAISGQIPFTQIPTIPSFVLPGGNLPSPEPINMGETFSRQLEKSLFAKLRDKVVGFNPDESGFFNRMLKENVAKNLKLSRETESLGTDNAGLPIGSRGVDTPLFDENFTDRVIDSFDKVGKSAGKAADKVKKLKIRSAELADVQIELMERMNETSGFFADRFARGFREWIDGSKKFSEAFRDMASSILFDLGEMIVRQQIFNLLRSNADSVGNPKNLFGSILGVIGNLAGLGTKRYADGGRPPFGQVSLVGERGPELFVPDTAGMIRPLSFAGAGPGITVNQTNHFGSDLTRAEVLPLLEENRRQTIAEIQEGVRLGGDFRRGMQR